mgnify:CR=1 FL=1
MSITQWYIRLIKITREVICDYIKFLAQLYMRLTKLPVTQLYIIVTIFVVMILFLSYLFFQWKHEKEKKGKGKK